MKILNQSTPSEFSGKQNVQSYSPEYSIMTPKYTMMKMEDFLDLYQLPSNLKEVECKNAGRKFHFPHSFNPETIKSEAAGSFNL